jgi:hypothetical protein
MKDSKYKKGKTNQKKKKKFKKNIPEKYKINN